MDDGERKGRGRFGEARTGPGSIRTTLPGVRARCSGFVRRRRDILFLGLLFVLQALLLLPFRDYVTDDTYIHLTFARNLAAGDGFAFHPGVPVYGSTAPLWVFCLAAGARLGVDLLVLARSLGLIFTFASVLAVHGLARAWIPERRWAALATLAWATDAWLLRWSVSGMDTALAVFLVAAALAGRARREQTVRGVALTLTWASLLALTRPEGLVFLGLAWLDVLLPTGIAREPGASGRSAAFWPRAVAATLPPLLLVVPWLLYAARTFGHVLPTSVAAKTGPAFPAFDAVLATFTRELVLLGATRVVELGLLLVLGLLLLRPGSGRRRLPAARRLRASARELLLGPHRLALVWGLVLLLGFALRDAVVVSRHVLLLVPGLVVAAWALAAALLRGAGTAGRPRLAAVFLGLGLVAVSLDLGVLLLRVRPHAEAFPRGLEASFGEIAAWLRTESPPGALVAAADIGLLGYCSERRILDLSGIASPEMASLQQGMPIEDFVSTFGFASHARPDYLVDRAIERERLPARGPHGERLEVLLVRRLGPLGLGRTSAYYTTLYAVDWREVP